MNKVAERYLRAVRKALHCPGRQGKRLLRQLGEDIEEYCEEHLMQPRRSFAAGSVRRRMLPPTLWRIWAEALPSMSSGAETGLSPQ